MWKSLTKLLGWAVVAAQVVGSAMGHGFLAEPKARNVVHNSNYCSHCLAAGGPGVTFAGGRKWPNSLHGVCGDPHNAPRDHEAGGKFASKVITGKYKQGQTISIKITVTAPHAGRFSFGICPVPDGGSDADERRAVTQACLDKNALINAADGTKYWWLGRQGSGSYTMQFTLPAGVSCTRCVLQWHWESGNSCTIPGTPAQHIPSVGQNMVACDQTGVMEEFWNCADVSVAPGAGKPAAAAKPKVARRLKETFANAIESDWLAGLVAVLGVLAVLSLPFALGVAAGAGVLVFTTVRRLAPPPRLAYPPPLGPPQPALGSTLAKLSRRTVTVCRSHS